MTAVAIRDVARRFGAVAAVDGVSLEVASGELFTLLGPSGCGKTTLLRMIAGFADPERGSIWFGARRIDQMPPHRRNTAMVFQNYAIFPTLSVRANVAYGLKARRVAASEIARRVDRALDLVQLAGLAERMPHQLSGGQLQRVALARSLVIEPDVLLLDEPLSNLDARLRLEMRREIRALQQSLGITAIYVTHDQEEALAISDRIAVMRAGRIEQVGRPGELYRRPATAFVAAFLGAANLLTGQVVGRDEGDALVHVGATEFRIATTAATGETLSFALRPEVLQVLRGGTAAAGMAVLQGQVVGLEFLGPITRIDLALDPAAPPLQLAALDLPPDGIAAGSTLTVAYDPRRATVFGRR